MVVSLLIYYLLITAFQLSAVSGQTFSLIQPATGPSSVCEGSDVTLLCAVALILDNTTTIEASVWSRNISGIVTPITTQTPIPNHRVVFNSTNRAFTDLVITNVTLEDDNAVYNCGTTGTPITSSVVLNVTGIPAVESLTAVDNCVSVAVSWNIITDEGSCKDLSYNVSLISPDDGVILQSNTTNDTSHNFTDVQTLIEMFNVTSIKMFNVSVTAVNGNAKGSSHTATADVRVPSNDLPLPVDLKNLSSCVTFFDVSWNAFNEIPCGDVSYEVSVFQPSTDPGQRMVQFNRTGDDEFYSNITGLNNSDPDVMVTVTASNRAGNDSMNISVQLPQSQDPPPINDATASTNRTPANLRGFDIFFTWTRPKIDDPCTTLPISLYIINASVTFMNGSQANYVSNNIMDTSGDSMGRFNVSYNDSFNEELVPNATYVFTINSSNVQIPPSPPLTTMTPTTNNPPISTGVMIVIIINSIILVVLIICAGIAAAYLYVKIEKDEKDPSTAIVVLMWVLFILSLGVGLIFVAIWQWKNRDVQPDEIEMTDKPSEVYASPKKLQKDDTTDGKATDQSLYCYARTGPINVVVPGGKP